MKAKIILCFLLFSMCSFLHAQTIYVKSGGTGDGTSWEAAYGNLQLALQNTSYGTEIWIAAGTYTPISCSDCTINDRKTAFDIPDGVALYGGFNGTETERTQRNWEDNPTILSGDIDNDGTSSNNSYSIITTTYVSNQTIVDGMILEKGNADSSVDGYGSVNNSGAAWYNNATLNNNISEPVIRNCIFRDNFAFGYGGAIYNDGSFTGSVNMLIENCLFEDNVGAAGGGAVCNRGDFEGDASPIIRSCIFRNNTASLFDGGAIANSGSANGYTAPIIEDCLFENNYAEKNGGAIHSFGQAGQAHPIITNCEFLNNYGNIGGAINNNGAYNGSSNPIITNCNFFFNTGGAAGGALHSLGSEGGSSNPVVSNCRFENNHSLGAGAGIFNNGVNGSCNGVFTNCTVIDNLADTYGAGMYNLGKSGDCSPTVTNCLFVRNQALSSGGMYNLGSEGGNSSPKITNCTFYKNKAMVGGGIYSNANDETGNASPIITNCILWKNEADFGAVFRNIYGTPNVYHTVVYEANCDDLNSGAGSNVNCQEGVLYNVDPLFVDEENDDFRLSENSPLRDIGDNNAIIGANVTTDLSGNNRIDNSMVDLGAYEYITVAYEAPMISMQTESASICEDESISFSIAATGTPPLAYQWQKNGVDIPDANNNIYTINNTMTSDAGTYTCVVSSSTGDSVTSDAANLVVNTSVEATIEINTNSNEICEGQSVNFTTEVTNTGDNPSYDWQVNGNSISLDATTFSSNMLNDGDVVSCVLTSSASCVSNPTLTSNDIVITITPTVEASITITANVDMICENESIIFTSEAINPGTNPVYQWQVNGENIAGANNINYTDNVWTDGDIVSCTLLSSEDCVSNLIAYSNNIPLEVSPLVLPTISIEANTNTICAGENIDFNALVTDEGNNPTYQWQINGENVGINAPNFSSSNLLDGDAVSCILTSNADCAMENTITSESIIITITATGNPSISINTTTTTVCEGEAINFDAVISNGGNNPSYQWQVNGENAGTNAPTFTSTTLNDSDIITCLLTSDATCVEMQNAASNELAITVNPIINASISVSASSTEICEGESITFNTETSNAGDNPTYQWLLNGNSIIGANEATYSNDNFNNNDIITCMLTATAECLANAEATSNELEISVNPTISATITITSDATEICAGETINFSAEVTNAGDNPTYQWQLNGENVGTSESDFSSNMLNDGDVVNCVLISDAVCIDNLNITSNDINIQIVQAGNPSLVIEANTNTICEGEAIDFMVTNTTNSGNNPSYQWQVNGENAGTNEPTFTSTTLNDGDIVSCILITDATCVEMQNTTSNEIAITVNTTSNSSIVISASSTEICAGESITFNTETSNAGDNPAYQWLLNGNSIIGANEATYSNDNFNNNDIITCVLTADAECLANTEAISNELEITLSESQNASIEITASPAIICAGETMTFTANTINAGDNPSYQWYINDEATNTNTATFESNTLNDGDVVSCVLVSNAACVVDASVSSTPIQVNVNPILIPNIIIEASSSEICAGESITFDANITNGGNNPSYQWQVNGENAGTNAPTFTSTTLNDGDIINCILIADATCVEMENTTSNEIAITVNTGINASIAISASSTEICADESITFNTETSNAGDNPAYQWLLNGNSIIGANEATYSNDNFNNNDIITCVLTADAECLANTEATSNELEITLSESQNASIEITASPAIICAGETMTFTANTINAGDNPSYQWYINDETTNTNTATFESNTLNDGDVVSCVLVSNAACVVDASVSSTPIQVNVNPALIPNIIIEASSSEICAGESITFDANITNGGNNPSYQWQVNGENAGTNAPSFTSTTLNDGDIVSCILIADATCVEMQNTTSNEIAITVNTGINASIAISASSTEICAGESITFNTETSNAGDNPTYQWLLNGNNIIGANDDIYSNDNFNNNDIITCVLTADAECLANTEATSNELEITVNETLNASIEIIASPAIVCAGETMTFTANTTNAGDNPSYQWYINGEHMDTNANTFESNTLNDGDAVSCILMSDAICVTNPSVTSAIIQVQVMPIVSPSITIEASNTNICAGESITFDASIMNGGNNPAYQWMVNDQAIQGATGATFATSNLNNNDVIICTLTSTANCADQSMVSSNAISITVDMLVANSVNITSDAMMICAGETVTFSASTTNAGTAPTYQWYINDVIIVGTNAATFATSNLSNNDIIYCEVTSAVACVSNPVSNSNELTIEVMPQLTASTAIVASSTTICAGEIINFTALSENIGMEATYQWFVNGDIVQDATMAMFSTTNMADTDEVYCEINTSANCVSNPMITSNTIAVSVLPNINATISVEASSDQICRTETVIFEAITTNEGDNASYQWQLNGEPVGFDTNTYSTDLLEENAVIQCILYPSSTCQVASEIVSEAVVVEVWENLIATIEIEASATDICASETVSFEAFTTSEGSDPHYEWEINGIIVGTDAPTFTTNSLNDEDLISCTLISNENCVVNPITKAIPITVNVEAVVVPTIVIEVDNSTICAEEAANFTAITTNAGAAPTYQWLLNGIPVGINDSSYNVYSLEDGDVVSCVLTTEMICASEQLITSNNIAMSVLSNLVPDVNIMASDMTICEGESITFNAIASNSGDAASYEWYVNDVLMKVGTNSYTDTEWMDGDVIYCVLKASADCLMINEDTSNEITISVASIAIPSIEIISLSDSICAGDPALFSIETMMNGGSNPQVEWYRNGIPTGITSNEYLLEDGSENDVINCMLTSSLACVTAAQVSSNLIDIHVAMEIEPTVAIFANNEIMCEGEELKFSLVSTNTGLEPSYLWYWNGEAVSVEDSLQSDAFVDGDELYVRMESSANCVIESPTISDVFVVEMDDPLIAEIDVYVNNTNICLGDTVAFIATAINGGNNPLYQWYVNDVVIQESNAPVFLYAELVDGDIVECLLTANKACLLDSEILSESIIMNVNNCSTATSAINLENAVNIYPNPSSGQFNIALKLPLTEAFEIEVVDLNGRLLYTDTASFTKQTAYSLDLSAYVSGIYFVHLTSKSARSIHKIVVE